MIAAPTGASFDVRPTALRADIVQARRFLRLLDPTATAFTFQTFADSEQATKGLGEPPSNCARILEGSIAEVAERLQALNNRGAGVFVTVNETRLNGTRNRQCITRVRAVFADLDGAPIEPVVDCALRPHVIVETSPGRYQAFWMVHALDLEQFKEVQQAIAARFGSDRSVVDLPRVTRLPGFYHRKQEPFMARIHHAGGTSLPYAASVVLSEFAVAGAFAACAFTPASIAPAPNSASSMLVSSQIPKGRRNSALLIAAGRLRSKGLDQAEIESLLLDINRARCIPPLDELEVRDIAGRYAKPDGNGAQWDDPEAIPDTLPPVPNFDPLGQLPTTLINWVTDVGDRMQCPIDYLGVAIMVACGSLIGAQIGVRPKQVDDWYEVPNFWGLVIGPSGDKKTPALSEMLTAMRKLQDASTTQHEQALAAFNLSTVVHEQDLARKKADHKAGKYTLTASDLVAPARPPQRRYLVHDTTVEALGVILQDNPNGVMCYADELVGLLSRLDGEERRADRAFYLAGYNGKNNFSVDRITRDPVRIARLCLSILGSTQPDAIRQYLHHAVSGGIGNDGLVQRFQLAVYPDRNKSLPKIVDRAPYVQGFVEAMDTFRRLDALDPVSIGAQQGGFLPTLGFDAQAQPQVLKWLLSVEQEMQQSNSHPALMSHYSKFRKTIPSLALVIHLAEGDTGPIGRIAFEKALVWWEYLRSHAQRIYASVEKGHMDGGRLLANRIDRGKLRDGFTARDVLRNGWTLLSTTEQVRDALDVLVEYGWVRSYEDAAAVGRPTTRYRIHPSKPRAS